MQKGIKIFAVLCLLVFVLAILLGFSEKTAKKEWTTYTVQSGDRLWDIAKALGVQNWDEWRYETCEVNGIRQGGMIYPGDTLIVSLPAMK